MNKKNILKYLQSNPVWLSGFASGEGCFTSSFMVYTKGKWGLQPQCEFNITQKNNDKDLLLAINEYFNNKGGVYDKPNNMSVVTFRNITALKEEIIPFFKSHTLLSTKKLEFNKWCKLVEILHEQNHIGDTLASRDVFLEWAIISKDLNSLRNNPSKQDRIDKIISWLKELRGIPSKECKLELKERISKK